MLEKNSRFGSCYVVSTKSVQRAKLTMTGKVDVVFKPRGAVALATLTVGLATVMFLKTSILATIAKVVAFTINLTTGANRHFLTQRIPSPNNPQLYLLNFCQLSLGS